MTTSPRDDAVVTVGDYTLMTKIGEGGMGVVHLARRPGEPRVALKMLRPHIVGDDEARARLAREVSSLRRIRSAWVAEIVDADPWAPIPYVATRYVPGLPLHDHVIEHGPIGQRDLLWFAACLAEGVASVHAVGVLHRDIKPSNVLMEGRTPILIDFGLARVADDPKLTHTGWLLGTPGYLAPEILFGDDATTASDVHSWAATVAYAASGSPPFGRGPSMAIMDRVRRGEHDLSGVPGPLREALAAALAPEPERRPTLEALLTWLRPLTTRPEPGAADLSTIPLVVAAQAAPTAQAAQAATTTTAPVGAPDDPATRVLPTEVASVREAEPDWERDWDEQWAEPAPPPVPFLERVRRLLLVSLGATVVGAGAAAAPWVTLTLVVLAVWLLRSGSLAAGAVGDKRRLRGRKWYDGAQLVVSSPWRVLQSLPATIGLLLWSAGLALAAALLCYAVAAGLGPTLFASGVVLAGSLWWGPGGSRVRGPLNRVVRPLSRRVGPWLVAVAVLTAVALGLVWGVSSGGTSWAPASERPFASFEVPEGGILGG